MVSPATALNRVRPDPVGPSCCDRDAANKKTEQGNQPTKRTSLPATGEMTPPLIRATSPLTPPMTESLQRAGVALELICCGDSNTEIVPARRIRRLDCQGEALPASSPSLCRISKPKTRTDHGAVVRLIVGNDAGVPLN